MNERTWVPVILAQTLACHNPPVFWDFHTNMIAATSLTQTITTSEKAKNDRSAKPYQKEEIEATVDNLN